MKKSLQSNAHIAGHPVDGRNRTVAGTSGGGSISIADYSGVAQWVGRLPVKETIDGSSPSTGA